MGFYIKFELHVHIHREGRENENITTKSLPTASSNEPASEADDFFLLAQQLIGKLSQMRSPSTIENYRTALRSFSRFVDGSLPVSQLNAELIQSYEHWLKEHNISKNTISCYMRSLRALTTRLCGEDALPIYNKVYTGRSTTEKRAVEQDELTKLRHLKLAKDSFLGLVRDLFLFSFYALGMPFVDMAFLRRSQISNGQIVYFRHKTGQRICINIEPCMQEIIDRYASLEREYVFPLLKSPEPDEAYREYQQKLNRYNKALKQLAAKAGITRKLTSYVSRHTWASIAFSSDVGIPVISKALGHANPQNTLIYIQQINDQRIYNANRKIIQETMSIA